MGVLLALQQQNRSVLSVISYLFRVCALPGLSGLAITLLLDRFMFGFWAIPFLGNIHFNVILGRSILSTNGSAGFGLPGIIDSPNNVCANHNTGNGSLYGTHPFHVHYRGDSCDSGCAPSIFDSRLVWPELDVLQTKSLDYLRLLHCGAQHQSAQGILVPDAASAFVLSALWSTDQRVHIE
jgi:hypothetical protein